MKIDPTIFREYDIRGLVDEDLTEDGVASIGRAYAAFAQTQGAKTVSVGRDCREHSPRLSKALASGLTEGGLDVLELGVVTTPMLYFSLHTLPVDGGIQITGSHNPPAYNGLKISLGKTSLHGQDIQRLHRIIEDEAFGGGAERGEVRQHSVTEAYVNDLAARIKLGAKKLKVVVDAGNGTGGPFALQVLDKLGVEVVPLYCEMDATFPNHHPDPTVAKNLEDLRQTVLREGADLGLAYDGDADRIGAVDEKGQILWGDQMMILFSRAVLQDEPGATIVGEVKCSQTLYDDIEKQGGKAIMWRTGHSLIKDKMKQTGAALAGEMSGHIFFRHRFFGFDDGIYAGLRLLELVSRAEQPLSALLADVPQTFNTPEIRVECPESLKFPLVERLVAHFKREHEVIDIDGARVVFDDGWGLVRASNTQALLVLRFEANSEARLREIQTYVENALAEVRTGLEAGP